jgi:hypothetical protein
MTVSVYRCEEKQQTFNHHFFLTAKNILAKGTQEDCCFARHHLSSLLSLLALKRATKLRKDTKQQGGEVGSSDNVKLIIGMVTHIRNENCSSI